MNDLTVHPAVMNFCDTFGVDYAHIIITLNLIQQRAQDKYNVAYGLTKTKLNLPGVPDPVIDEFERKVERGEFRCRNRKKGSTRNRLTRMEVEEQSDKRAKFENSKNDSTATRESDDIESQKCSNLNLSKKRNINKPQVITVGKKVKDNFDDVEIIDLDESKATNEKNRRPTKMVKRFGNDIPSFNTPVDYESDEIYKYIFSKEGKLTAITDIGLFYVVLKMY